MTRCHFIKQPHYPRGTWDVYAHDRKVGVITKKPGRGLLFPYQFLPEFDAGPGFPGANEIEAPPAAIRSR